MRSRTDFWLTLHQLASELKEEGHSHDERAAVLCEVLACSTPSTKAVYLENLVFAQAALSELLMRCDPPATNR
jgi:hypothetical protein